MKYGDFEFKEICGPNPEQYDVFKNGHRVAYVRLRFGILTCETPYVGDKTIYCHRFMDGSKGRFANQEERNQYLNEIAYNLKNCTDAHYVNNTEKDVPAVDSIFCMQTIGW